MKSMPAAFKPWTIFSASTGSMKGSWFDCYRLQLQMVAADSA